MIPKVKQMYISAKDIHHHLVQESVHLFTETQDAKLAEQVDAVYALRKTEELLDDVRKVLTKLRKKIEVRGAAMFEIEGVEKIMTPYCTGTTKITQHASFPHKKRNDPQAYQELMDDLGIPQKIIDHEGVRLNWEGFCKYFSERQSNGEPLPKGIDPAKVYTIFELPTRKKMDPDE